MSFRVDVPWITGAFLVGNQGGGVLAENIPSTGDDGSGYAFPMLVLPGDLGKEIRGLITYVPPGLTLQTFENTSSIASGPDGSYTAYYQPYVDYVPFGSPLPIVFAFGSGYATAPGASLAGTSSFTGGGASAGGAGAAPGAALTSSGAFSGGAAIGNSSATAPGANLLAVASILAGAASNGSYARSPAGSGYSPRKHSTITRPTANQDTDR